VGAAIARAMAMPLAERKSRHAALYAALLRNDISQWGDKFLAALVGTKKFDLKEKPKGRAAADPPFAAH
jgi:trehalose 6-phosphate synthase